MLSKHWRKVASRAVIAGILSSAGVGTASAASDYQMGVQKGVNDQLLTVYDDLIGDPRNPYDAPYADSSSIFPVPRVQSSDYRDGVKDGAACAFKTARAISHLYFKGKPYEQQSLIARQKIMFDAAVACMKRAL